jgi:uncharacterized RmlC-like cupin family protein
VTIEENAGREVQLVAGASRSSVTAQSEGMQRYEAVSGATVGASRIWMGESVLAPDSASSAHHHGDSETGIYVLSGNPSFVFLRDGREVRLDASPGDYVFVPGFVAHREENHSLEEPAVVILARSTQEAIVVNLDHL